MAISCDPSTLANAARCFNDCTRGPIGQSIKTYLLCQYSNIPQGPFNPDFSDASIFTDAIFTWTNPTPNATSNEVWKSTNGGAFVLVSTVAGSVSSYHDPGVLAGNAFWTFKVRGVTGGVPTAFSDTRSVCYTVNKAAAADTSANLSDLVFVLNDPNDAGGGLLYNNMPNLASFSAPLLRRCDGNILLNDCPMLSSVTLPLVTSVGETCNCQFFFDNCVSLPTLSLPKLARQGGNGGNFHLTGCTALASVNLSSLINCGGDFNFDNCTSLASFSCPSLTGVAESLTGSGSGFATASFPVLTSIGVSCIFAACPSLTSINLNSLQGVSGDMTFVNSAALLSGSFPALTFVIGDVIFSGCTALASLSLPLCAFGQNFRCLNCINLVTVTLTTATFADGGFTILFTGDKVAAGVSASGTGINGILRRGVASGTTTDDYELAGGTNAAPSGGGIADKATLIGNGNVVNTN